MTNVLLAGFTSYWHRRKSSMRTTPGERPPALRGCPQLRSVPSLWRGMREQACSIPRGLKINKNSAESEVFLVDFPSYRTLQMLSSQDFDELSSRSRCSCRICSYLFSNASNSLSDSFSISII